MSVKLQFCERQTFWMEPDCYDGKTCNQMRPRWMTSYPKEGKEEDGEVLKLEIDASSMPPGSRVTIEVPICPNCGDPADIKADCLEKHKEWPDCDCGFSWNEWGKGSILMSYDPESEVDKLCCHLRQENQRLVGEVEAWRKEVAGSASGATFTTIKNLQTELGSWKRLAKENAIIADKRLEDLMDHKDCLEVARVALERVWEIEEMGYTPDDPESESGVCFCDKCEGVQHHNHKSHSENCPQPIIENALTTVNQLLEKK